jgi:hypothetical protein
MFVTYDPESYSITDDNCNPYPALITKGCGCCSDHKRVTAENLATAIREAEEWLKQLKTLSPVHYPDDVTGGF